MGLKYERIFWMVTTGVLIACAISFLYLMSSSRSAGIQSAQEDYSIFATEWESRFSTEVEDSSTLSTSSDFLDWFRVFAEINPNIQSIVVEDSNSRLFSWQRSTFSVGEITQAEFSDRKVSFFDYPTELRITMHAIVITHSDFIYMFRIMGYIVMGYAVFLLIFLFSGLSRSRKPAMTKRQFDPPQNTDVSDDQQFNQEQMPQSPLSPNHSDLHLRLRSELDLSAQQEKDMCLVLLHAFPVAGDDRTTEDWLTERFVYRDLIFPIGGDRYAVILPDSTITRGVSEAKRTINHWEETAFAGVTSRGGRLIDPERFIKEAKACLKKAHSAEDKVVGFHPDPQKYRQFIAKSIS